MRSQFSTGTALVTGASSGIGRELAREFAGRGHSVVVVAPGGVKLLQLAEEISQETGVTVTALPKDLHAPNAANEIFLQLQKSSITVEILANNADLGYRADFWNSPIEHDLEMMRVNIESGLRLTKLFLPGMIARGHGRILNTASVAAFEPGPLLAVYHATKAFVLSWTEGLATELAATGVTVTALCPAPVDTDFFAKADLLKTRAFQESNLMGPREVARAGVDGVLRGERIVVPGARNRMSVFSRRDTSEADQAKANEDLFQESPPVRQKREPGDVEDKEWKAAS